MASEVHQFSATIPAGTAKSAPVTIQLGQANYEIESIDLEVPPGPSGLMGFYIALSGQQWLPWEMGEYIIWNDRTESWQTNDYTVNGGWEVVGYNTGMYDHTIAVRFHVNPIVTPTDDWAPPLWPVVTIVENVAAAAAVLL